MLIAAVFLAIAPPLLIHKAQVDITPPELLPLGGYTERHGKVMEPDGDRLYARCVEFQQGPTTIAVVSVEMLTIPESLYREVSDRIPRSVHLFLQATHTHCAPDSQMLNDRMTFAIPGVATYRKRWLTWYADKIASCVAEASETKAFSPTYLSTITFQIDANRARRKGGQPDKRCVMLLEGRSDDPGYPPLLGFYTAHPTIYGPEESKTRGDWIGGLDQRFQTTMLNGAIGDVSPKAEGTTPEAKLQDFYQRFGQGVATGKTRPLPRVWKMGDSITWANDAIPLDAKKPHPTFAKTNGIPEALAQSLVDQFAASTESALAFRVGKLAIVGVPGEPTSILGNQIQQAGERMGFKTVLVCSHVNGWMGYILDPVDYDQGGYEATLSFYGRDEGAKVVKAAIAALRKLR